MRIGIFGGSFNPPHKMHLNIATKLLKKDYVDKIIFVPTGSKYKYKTNLISDKYRLEMLKIIVKNNNNLDVSDFELKDYVVYTFETLKYFQELYPNDEIYFICGADNLSYIDEWKNAIEILSNYKILVIDREGFNINELLDKFNEYKENIIITNIKPDNISSTNIRLLIKEKNIQELKKYLNLEVIEFIDKEKLYES